MSTLFRVRFAPAITTPAANNDGLNWKRPSQVRQNPRRKSQLGCRECKSRRVKCDEAFPVCRRCQRRGTVCRSVPRHAQWQVETPWLSMGGLFSNVATTTNHRRLQYWFEKASQIMVIDPEINPLSFPIIKYLDCSPSLIHSLQSISAGHENYFGKSSFATCLEERHRAIKLFQEELRDEKRRPEAAFLTVLTLGMSSTWVDAENEVDFGQVHLSGLRALLDILLAERSSDNDTFTYMAVGCYIYWDQACAFLLPAAEQIPIDAPEISRYVQEMRAYYHPIMGYSTEIFYLLGRVGRYCRTLTETGVRNYAIEEMLMQDMLAWEPPSPPQSNHELYLMGDAFRQHGVTFLLRTVASVSETAASEAGAEAIFCKAINCSVTDDEREFPPEVGLCYFSDYEPSISDDSEFSKFNLAYNNADGPEEANGVLYRLNHHDHIRQSALTVLENIMQIPVSCSYAIVLALPLFTAGSELTAADGDLREEVRKRLKALYSMNRIMANLKAIRLLEEVWELRDAGKTVFWLSLMLQKNWRLVFT